jgi:thioredoxin-dependent peroxiredoxin
VSGTALRVISLSLALATASLSGACGTGCGGAQGHTDRAKLLTVGSEVPSLVRVDHRGKVVALRGGPPTLLYFYPKDGTPGCTKEACAFRDSWDKYAAAQLRVIGVSTDTEERHRAFAEEHDLPFSLIADPERIWSDAFGVGSFLGGMDERVSFLIDGHGRVAKVYADVDPGLHANEVLADAKQLGLSP